jgi:hypothetical protein
MIDRISFRFPQTTESAARSLGGRQRECENLDGGGPHAHHSAAKEPG